MIVNVKLVMINLMTMQKKMFNKKNYKKLSNSNSNNNNNNNNSLKQIKKENLLKK